MRAKNGAQLDMELSAERSEPRIARRQTEMERVQFNWLRTGQVTGVQVLNVRWSVSERFQTTVSAA